VCLYCRLKFGDQRGNLQQIENMRSGDYSGVGIGIFRRKSEFYF